MKGRCKQCQRRVPLDEISWTYDRYGNPYMLVCEDCYIEVQKEISKWRFDYLDAGEYLAD